MLLKFDTRPLLLDAFCGAGGSGWGYYQAGFRVVGIDNVNMKRYPREMRFILGDAIEFVIRHGASFDAITGSPPCQAFSDLRHLNDVEYLDLLTPFRAELLKLNVPYVIENVPGAPLLQPVVLCGTMFPGLNVTRHREFEVNWGPLEAPGKCNHIKKSCKLGRKPNRETEYPIVAGNFSDVEFARESMGISWMSRDELSQAIPPPYTQYIGTKLLEHMKGREVDFVYNQRGF